jgi:hypothetical protein
MRLHDPCHTPGARRTDLLAGCGSHGPRRWRRRRGPDSVAAYGAALDVALAAALTERWAVEFQIADFPRGDGSFNIPFFSKLTLRDEARRLEGMEFDVSVRFIKLTKAAVDAP